MYLALSCHVFLNTLYNSNQGLAVNGDDVLNPQFSQSLDVLLPFNNDGFILQFAKDFFNIRHSTSLGRLILL